jgi:multidrug resistance efflux pump
MAESQARLDRAAGEIAGLRRQLDQEKAQAADLQARLEKAETQAASPQPAAAPAMPVYASFAKGFLSSSYAMHLKNLNSGPLKVTVTVNGSQKPAKSAVIEAGGVLDVDDLAAGQEVAVASEGFAILFLTVK